MSIDGSESFKYVCKALPKMIAIVGDYIKKYGLSHMSLHSFHSQLVYCWMMTVEEEQLM